jgi:benzoate membrane transport protein
VSARALVRDLSAPAVVAGFIAVLVGFTSSVALVFAAAQNLGADEAQLRSWIWALGLGMAVTSIGLSWWTRLPVLTAWSTPGAALLAATSGVTLSQAIGAFVICGLLTMIAGWTGWFERVMNRIPQAIASALLAGVLARFGLDAVGALRTDASLVLVMTLAFLIGRQRWPRFAVPGVLVAGVATALMEGRLSFQAVAVSTAWPQAVMPQFDLATTIGVAVPLFIVAMASQNLPGVAAQRASGYAVPISPVLVVTGAVNVLLAPFGGFGFNLAAITAAICMGPEAHEDPSRRYTAAVAAGGFYLLAGLGGGAVVALLQAFPRELVLGLAALALLATTMNGLAAALKDESQRDAAGLTFLVTLSGVSLLGIGSAFWGLVAGTLAWAVPRLLARRLSKV